MQKKNGEELCYIVIKQVSIAVGKEIEEWWFGAEAIDHKDARQGYYLLQYTSINCAYIDQNIGKRMCKAYYWNDAGCGIKPWFTPGPHEVIVEAS